MCVRAGKLEGGRANGQDKETSYAYVMCIARGGGAGKSSELARKRRVTMGSVVEKRGDGVGSGGGGGGGGGDRGEDEEIASRHAAHAQRIDTIL